MHDGERRDPNDRLASLGLRFRKILVDQAVQSAALLENDCSHDELSISGRRCARDSTGRREVAGSAGKEVADCRRDLRGVGLQREMSGIEEAYDGVRDVPFERLSARRQEERIVLAPHR